MTSPYPLDHCMIDLETAGTRPRSVILTLGAIKFSPFGSDEGAKQAGQLVGLDTFYRRIDIQSCLDIGLAADPKTLAWWEQQDAAARAEAFAPDNRFPIRQVMEEFSRWYGTCQFPWSHGKEFDITILNEIYALLNRDAPWKFWDGRDTRTAYAMCGISNLPKGGHHHALWDCWRQVVGVQRAYAKLRGGGNLALAPASAAS